MRNTNAIVTAINWKQGAAMVSVKGAGAKCFYQAKRVVVTVPVSILRVEPGMEGTI